MLTLKNRIGLYLLGALSLITITALFWLGPLAQDPGYHLFSDTRTILLIPHFWNVLSNAPFLAVGLLGLYKLLIKNELQIIDDFRSAYIVLFVGVSLVGFGSSYYHLNPDNHTLVWDRLPMTIAFMALFSIVIAEFISIKIGKTLFIPLLIAGIASVWYWNHTELLQHGDLRFYGIIQFLPAVAIPIILICFQSRFSNISGYWWLSATYLLAKLFEQFDAEIYKFFGIVSGHSLKHIVAAVGIFVLLCNMEHRMFRNIEKIIEHNKSVR